MPFNDWLGLDDSRGWLLVKFLLVVGRRGGVSVLLKPCLPIVRLKRVDVCYGTLSGGDAINV